MYNRYSASKAWLVVAAWPLLALFSDRFRQEIRTALQRKELYKVLSSELSLVKCHFYRGLHFASK